ncbi:MAG: type II secretion system F family protein [Planctomycetota bacterium]
MSADATTPRLNEESLSRLLDEVAAMAASHRPLVHGFLDLQHQSLRSLGRAATQIQTELEKGRPDSEAVAEVAAQYQAPVQAAMEVLHRTGSPRVIQETARLLRRTAVERQKAREALLGPLVHILFAVALLFGLMPWLSKSLSETEFGFDADSFHFFRFLADHSGLSITCGILVFVCLAGLLIAGTTRFGDGSQRTRHRALFCRWLALQVDGQTSRQAEGAATQSNIELSQIIASASAVGGKPDQSEWRATVDALQAGAISREAIRCPTGTPAELENCLVRLARGTEAPDAIARELRDIASLESMKASRQSSRWIQWAPRLFSYAVMLLFIAYIVVSVIYPLSKSYAELS